MMYNKKNQDLLRSSVLEIGERKIKHQLLAVKNNTEIKPPISVQIDLTLRCTARCLHCHQWAWPEHSDYEFTELEIVLLKLSNWGVKTIVYSGGNPLLHHNINNILELSYRLGFSVGIISEGCKISIETAAAITDFTEWIRFSLDGPNSKVHDTVRNREGIFDDVFHCIKLISQYKKSTKIGLNFVVQRKNIHFLDKMLMLNKNKDIDLILFKIPHGEDPLKKYTLTKEDFFYFKNWVNEKVTSNETYKTNLVLLKKMLEEFYEEEDVIIGAPTKSLYKNKMCFAPLFSIVIDSHGYVYPCCYLHADNRHWKKSEKTRNKFVVGNILDENILERLDKDYKSKISHLPSKQQKECTNCTRSCQLNIELTEIYNQLENNNDVESVFIRYFANSRGQEKDNVFL